MKFTVSVLLTALLAFAAGLYMPWWSVAVAAFVVSAVVHQRAGKAFAAGFTAIFFLWGGLALFKDIQNGHMLAQKIASVLPLGGNAMLLIAITATIGALVGGFAAMSGSYLRAGKKV